jgi:predicted secreted protein
MANAVAGVGTVFQRLNPNTDTWEDIAEINSIEGPNEDRDTIEVTSLDTEGGYDEFITGFMEGGTLVLNMNFNRSGYEVMKQDFEIDLVRNYRIVLPDDEDTTLEFEGLVTEIPITMEAENQLTADVTIQVSGEVTIASAGAESSVDVSEEPAESASSGWTPADLNPEHWWDFGDAATVTSDENGISEITDKGETSDLKSLLDESAGNSPSYAGGAAVFSAATFDHLMTVPSGVDIIPQPFTIMLDLDLDGNPGVQECIFFAYSSNIRLIHTTSQKLQVFAATNSIVTTNNLSFNRSRLVVIFNGDSSTVYQDGVENALSGNPGNNAFGANTGVGYNHVNGLIPCTMKLYELIVVPRAVTPAEVSAYETYCAAK